MADYVFTRISVYPRVTANTLITWELHPRFTQAGPYTYQVQVSKDGTTGAEGSEWADVGSTVEDANRTEVTKNDILQRKWAIEDVAYYRVKLTIGGSEWFSYAEPAWGSLQGRDLFIYKEIIRRELRRLKKTTAGTPGFLLSRRHWGAVDDNEVDPNTGSIVNPKSVTGFGTGFVGGYFPACSYWVGFNPGTVRATHNTEQGTTSLRVKTARALAYPIPRSYDIWVSCTDNRRYEIRAVKILSEIRNVPVTVELQLSEIPPTDIIYQFTSGIS